MIFSLFKKLTNNTKHDKQAYFAEKLEALKSLLPLDAIEFSYGLLTALSEDKDLTRQQYQFFLYELEASNQAKLNALISNLLPNIHVDRAQLTHVETLVYPYCRRLFLELMMLAEQMQADLAKGSFAHASYAAHLCRTLNAGLNICKWRYFDDQPAPSATWFNLHRLYQFAEDASVLYEPVRLAHVLTTKTDFASHYIAGLMLSTLQKSNYTAEELQISSTLLPRWFQGVAIEKGYVAEKHQYFMNLLADTGAERVRAKAELGDGRYWKTVDVVTKIETYLEAMRAKTLPKDSSVRAHGSVVTLYPLFKKLAQDWSVTHYRRQRRNTQRIKTEKKLLATYGLEQICDYLALHEKAYSKDLKDKLTDVAEKSMNELAVTEYALSKMQALMVVDESQQGLGINLGAEKPEHLQVGHLIGCCNPATPVQFLVTEVKSVRKQKNGHYRAGLKIVSTQFMLVKLSKLEHKTVELSEGFYLQDAELIKTVHSDKLNCLFIYDHDGVQHSKPSVIIPSSEYEYRRHFSFLSDGEEKIIEIGAPITKQADWVRAAIAAIN